MINDHTIESLLGQLRQLDECQRIEAKKGSHIGSSIMQSVCAFANEPGLGGGYILLGVSEPDAEHNQFYVSGVSDIDKLLNELQANCRDQFEQAVPIEAQAEMIEGSTVIKVFVPELAPASKPCTFKGKFDSKNKRKTGVWRRGINGDYECTQADIEPLLLAKSGLSFEQVVLPDAEWEDLDPSAIELYRTMRARVRPNAEELNTSDEDMLRSLNLIKKRGESWVPNVAGLLLMGKPLALRRLLPAVRVDYVRVNGTQWVEDPEQRFITTLDLREPLLRLIPRLENAITDDLPKHFRLNDGDLQRSDEPLLPYKVIREAVVNAVMHRDYLVNQPTLVIRYSNRIEIKNAGYSLKPETMLGETGSELRNPVIAAVLYDLNLAETKGTGIRTMRRLLHSAGLTAPVFSSNVLANEFQSIYLLHQLLGEEQLLWLQQYAHLRLSDDEARALILAKETGAVDNAGLRAVTDLDTLAASEVFKRLHHQLKLLEQGGAGSATYYQLNQEKIVELATERGDLDRNTQEFSLNAQDLNAKTQEFTSQAQDLPNNAHHFSVDLAKSDLPQDIQALLEVLPIKPRKPVLWGMILQLCNCSPMTSMHLARMMNRREDHLRASHLTPMRKEGLLSYLYPEVINHPQQAYVTTEQGKLWLYRNKEK